MFEKALYGGRRYWALLGLLGTVAAIGALAYVYQFREGLAITGLSRDVPWGFYIAQLTFMVGIAASAVMVVLPYYLHDYKAFGKITILGEFLAIPAVLCCVLFVFVDMGQPMRIVNMFLHPTPNSVMFWDATVLMGYLVLNVVISQVTLGAERKGIAPPKWIKPVIILSIPWAVSIHTVTAFLYSGLAARPFWMTAILAPRFLASAFASGPSLLILLCLVVRRFTKFDPGIVAIRKLSVIVAYAMATSIFFVLLELFTAFYSNIPEHLEHFRYMYFGLEGKAILAPWTWLSVALAMIAALLMLIPKARANNTLLVIGCVCVIGSLWIDKGLDLVIAGFVPSPLGHVTEYWPTLPEALIALSVYAIGAGVLTVLYKIAVSIREQVTYVDH